MLSERVMCVQFMPCVHDIGKIIIYSISYFPKGFRYLYLNRNIFLRKYLFVACTENVVESQKASEKITEMYLFSVHFGGTISHHATAYE